MFDVVCNLFCLIRNVHSINKRASILNFVVSSCSLTLIQNFIAFRGVLLWNSLTDDLASTV